MQIKRNIDVKNLVRELAENRVTSLELVREALSNAKDHFASHVWIRTTRDQRNQVSVFLIDDGEGMDKQRLEAFWGVGASVKQDQSIGYKGHGTKLYFDCQRLTVLTRTAEMSDWVLISMETPYDQSDLDLVAHSVHDGASALPEELRPVGNTLLQEVTRLRLSRGTAIFIDQIRFADTTGLLSRNQVESFCDWFTVVGDVRSGLFDTRLDFHQAIKAGGSAVEGLRAPDSHLRPLDVRIRINGEKDFYPLYQGPAGKDKEFLGRWQDDVKAFASESAILAFGHRFADQHESQAGAQRVRDDLTSVRLTSPSNWVNEDGIGIVARVEGNRRQRDTYLEAQWQNHAGLYSFDTRFGLWLCRDFIPVVQRNDLLKHALEKASNGRLQFDFNTLRNWQVFVNFQQFSPTANRNDISNQDFLEAKFVAALVQVLEGALKQQAFQDWVSRLRKARLDRRREQEVAQMESRRQDIVEWLNDKRKRDGIDPLAVSGFKDLDPEESLLMKAPSSEQELFYVYGLLSARYQLPIQILEYDTREGVDAIGRMRIPGLIDPPSVHGRIEFKFQVSANNPIDHFFDAIDAIICWKVDRVGDIYEESSSGDTIGRLQRRKKPTLKPGLDTHEIVYQSRNGERIIPVLQLSPLFRAQLSLA